MHRPSFRRAFTLIELLIVIAIIAILAVVVVLTLNPAELLRQSRDANRLSDLSTINEAINVYNTDQGGSLGYSLGTPSTTAISIADPSATSTAGDQCQGLGLSALPSGYTYDCAPSSTYRAITNTGWIPVNLASSSAGSPLSSLPIDPVNNTSSLFYYTYNTNGATYEITVPLESQKYAGQNLLTSNTDPTRRAAGTNPSLVSQAEGLVGYWNLDEGSGSTTADMSGNSNNGTWSGTAAGTSGYYSSGQVGKWAGAFDGSTDYINIPNSPNNYFVSSGSYTWSSWINITSATSSGSTIFRKEDGSTKGYVLQVLSNGNTWLHSMVGSSVTASTGLSTGKWYYLVVTYSNNYVAFYVNGIFISGGTGSYVSDAADAVQISDGYAPGRFNGLIDDVRLYNRALSVAEIVALYNAEK
jgi:prepilin-type N-terminal cleavage/methylation domain-containing protein